MIDNKVDDSIRNNLLLIVSELGYHKGVDSEDDLKESSDYVIKEETIPCLENLQNLLKHNHNRSEHIQNDCADIVGYLSEWNIIQKNLIPLFIHYGIGKECLDDGFETNGRNETITKLTLEIMVTITWPYISNKEKQITNISHYKNSFSDGEFFVSLMNSLVFCTEAYSKHKKNIGFASMSEQSSINIIQLSILLIRNVLFIPQIEISREHLHLEILTTLCRTHIMEFLMTLVSEMMDGAYTLFDIILLEIFYLVFHKLDPLFMFCRKDEEHVMHKELCDIVRTEFHGKYQHAHYKRHSNFCGSFSTELGTKKSVVIHSPQGLCGEVDINKNKRKKYWKPIKRGKCHAKELNHRMTQIYYTLSGVFLRSCFNSMIKTIIRKMDSHSNLIEENDNIKLISLVRYFLGLFRYFTIHNKENHNIGFETISSVMSRDFMFYIIDKMMFYHEDKKYDESCVVSCCFKEYLYTLEIMGLSHNETHRSIYRHIMSNLFYNMYRLETIAKFLRGSSGYTLETIKSFIELNDILLKLLDGYTKTNRGIVVKIKKRTENVCDDIEEYTSEKQTTIEYLDKIKFERLFANEFVIESYFLVFKEFEDNYDFINCIIVKMFYKISVDLHSIEMFYKLSFFNVLSNILSSSAASLELKDFSRFIVKEFFKKWKQYHLLVLEMFYPKSSSDCMRIKYSGESTNILKDMPLKERSSWRKDLYSYVDGFTYSDTVPSDLGSSESTHIITMDDLRNQLMEFINESTISNTIFQHIIDIFDLMLKSSQGSASIENLVIDSDSFLEFETCFRNAEFLTIMDILLSREYGVVCKTDKYGKNSWHLESMMIDRIKDIRDLLKDLLEERLVHASGDDEKTYNSQEDYHENILLENYDIYADTKGGGNDVLFKSYLDDTDEESTSKTPVTNDKISRVYSRLRSK